MSRTTAALAASATVFALLLAGCGDDSAATEPASTTAAPTAQLDASKAGMFVVSYRNAFPKLAEGRDDAALSGLLSKTCADITAGKSKDDVVAGIEKNAKNGATAATTEEAQAIYEMSKLMC
ncbi:hypothetical protein [Nocardia sp. AG03]|uniref:hypothetical protein n=1 Tax=Nocardia sp. AG03 TaxID=3025312 RepID=UPI0024183046|nr:hypothetical protein [Nocardia sp. AG03]